MADASRPYLLSRDLETYVEHYWSVEWDYRGVTPGHVEIPRTERPHELRASRGRPDHGRPPPYVLAAAERRRGTAFAVKFTPGGLYPFLCCSISTLTDTTTAIESIFGGDGVALARTVQPARSDARRVAIVEAFLRRRAPAPDEVVARVAKLVYAVAADRGIVKVDDFAARAAMHPRALQRLFAKDVGAGPKWVIQRYRLHEAAEQLASGRAVNQADLAMSLGYSDQAHFVRDFKSVVGTSPAAYARAGSTGSSTMNVRSAPTTLVTRAIGMVAAVAYVQTPAPPAQSEWTYPAAASGKHWHRDGTGDGYVWRDHHHCPR